MHGVRRSAARSAAVAEEVGEQRREGRVAHLAGEVLEEAVELVEVAEGDGQEGRGVGVLGAGDRAQLELQLVAEALDAAGDAHEVALVEAPGEQVGVAEDARGDGAGAVAQLEREVRRARCGRSGDPCACRRTRR